MSQAEDGDPLFSPASFVALHPFFVFLLFVAFGPPIGAVMATLISHLWGPGWPAMHMDDFFLAAYIFGVVPAAVVGLVMSISYSGQGKGGSFRLVAITGAVVALAICVPMAIFAKDASWSDPKKMMLQAAISTEIITLHVGAGMGALAVAKILLRR